jgi:hypothetical protein
MKQTAPLLHPTGVSGLDEILKGGLPANRRERRRVFRETVDGAERGDGAAEVLGGGMRNFSRNGAAVAATMQR